MSNPSPLTFSGGTYDARKTSEQNRLKKQKPRSWKGIPACGCSASVPLALPGKGPCTDTIPRNWMVEGWLEIFGIVWDHESCHRPQKIHSNHGTSKGWNCLKFAGFRSLTLHGFHPQQPPRSGTTLSATRIHCRSWDARAEVSPRDQPPHQPGGGTRAYYLCNSCTQVGLHVLPMPIKENKTVVAISPTLAFESFAV